MKVTDGWLRVPIGLLFAALFLTGTVSLCRAAAEPDNPADFSTSILTIYSLTPAQKVTVNQTISITNLSDTQYPTGYTFIIPSDRLGVIKVSDAAGTTLHPAVTTANAVTKINLTFPVPVVGQHKTQSYILEYEDADVWVGAGHVIELAIPPLNMSSPRLDATTKVILPADRCADPVSYPAASENVRDGSLVTLTFNHVPPTQSVFVRCARVRYVAVNLKYFLMNTNMTPIETQVTLPPDTAAQRLVFDRIEPSPLNLSTDADGNVIATYHLEPKQELRISVSARAALYGGGNPDFSIKTDDRDYISEQTQWPVKDPDIKKLASGLGSERAIYRYIMAQTKYNPGDPSKPAKRSGGKIILTGKDRFTEQDFVDSFITLTRAAGIMSRRLVGFAESNNENLRPLTVIPGILHVWAEYYDPAQKKWLAVDPAWEKTSLVEYDPVPDVNRLVLAINGTDDTNPYPAGYYQSPDSSGPDVAVTTIDPFLFPEAKLAATISKPFFFKLSLSRQANLKITNLSDLSLYHQQFTLKGDNQVIQQFQVDRLPLRNKVIIPVNIPNHYESFTLETGQDTIRVGGGTGSIAPATATAGVVAGVAGIIAVITGRLLVSRRQQ